MRVPILVLLFSIVRLQAQDPAVLADIDEAFALVGVRNMLESLPSHVDEMTEAAAAQFPNNQRPQLEPLIKEVSLKFLDPDMFYRQLRTYFVKHYDAAHMTTLLALERTTVYRTMRRLEEAAGRPAAQAARRRFEANLESDPAPAKRIDILQRLDEARDTTSMQVRIISGIVNALSAGLGPRMPLDLETQCASFTAKTRPVLAHSVLLANLYIYRNSEDADLEDYVAAVQQKDVDWFNRNLQEAILAVAAERSTHAGEYIKTKVSKVVLN